MKNSIILLFIGLASCSTPTYSWFKNGINQNDNERDFSNTRYTCLQQSQQRALRVNNDYYYGSATDQMETNSVLYEACMNANGWYRRVLQYYD